MYLKKFLNDIRLKFGGILKCTTVGTCPLVPVYKFGHDAESFN